MRSSLVLAAAVLTAAGATVLCEERLAMAADPPCDKSAQTVIGSTVKMSIEKSVMGRTPEGVEVDLYTLANAHGLKARVMTYGATLIALEAPDRHGKCENVTLHLESLDGYLRGHPFFGSIAGRYANRIAKGRFTLDGQGYQLATNNNNLNHLHGGKRGFDKAVWKAVSHQQHDSAALELTLISPDGDQGYPGQLTAKVDYILTDDNRLLMDYTATTDKPTILNLTNHTYWNLGGIHSGDILKHELYLNADRYLPVDAGLIPTGEIRSVKGTPMDFTTPATVGSRIDQVKPGYDHCYVLCKGPGEITSLAARVYDPASGRMMEVFTTQPGVQLYTGNFLDGKLGAEGASYTKHYALCLETQHFPDSPNNPGWPSTVLRPGEIYRQTTVHRFSVK